MATERTHGLLAGGDSAAPALNSGYHLAYLISAALVGLAVLRPRVAGRKETRLAAESA